MPGKKDICHQLRGRYSMMCSTSIILIKKSSLETLPIKVKVVKHPMPSLYYTHICKI